MLALDTVPAVVVIPYDPFIAYTSNILAVFGLRALYFALAGIKEYFKDLRLGIVAILILVGMKMRLSDICMAPISFIRRSDICFSVNVEANT
jgi:tellurite resistance protein TerC